MKIGISLFQFFQGEVGGAGEYIEQLIRHLPEYMNNNDQLFLFGNSKNLKPFDIFRNDSRIVSVPFLISPLVIKIIRLLDLILPNVPSRYISRKINKYNLDIVLFPQQSIFPHGIRAKKIVTVHDFIHLQFPELVGPFQRWSRKYKECYLIKNSDHIITVSDFSRNDLIKNFIFPEKRITFIYHGTSFDKFASEVNEVKTPYIFYPANPYPHKNHERLIEAFEKFKSTFPEIEGNLILSGNPTPSILLRIAESSAREFICHKGFVSKPDLLELYRGCKALFFPSLFEGFGIPIVEAMKYDKPIFCSDLSVFRELIGDAATYFNPNSIDEMVEHFIKIFGNKAVQPVNFKEYQVILKKFNWGECARNTIKLLKSVADSGAGNQ
jgi:glycosyltransferase involved in cell wall biosynthesis